MTPFSAAVNLASKFATMPSSRTSAGWLSAVNWPIAAAMVVT